MKTFRQSSVASADRELDMAARKPLARVLVVDDDQRVLNFVRIKLKASGYEIATATSGVLALAQISDFRPKLIVMDVYMPDKDGLRTLREARATTSAPAILMSGHDIDKKSLEGLGRVEFMPKPFNPDELVLRIRALISQGE